MSSLLDQIWMNTLPELQLPAEPWFSLALFFATTGLMIQRLGAMEQQGLEGTVLGTLIMPYCSGISNLIFAFVMGRSNGSGSLVLENCLVNNVTNLTLLIGLPAVFWKMDIFPARSRKKKEVIRYRVNRLSLLLTSIALLFFSGAVWALARDNTLDSADGLVLVGIFLFWQVFHVFDVLKQNVIQKRSLSWSLIFNMIFIFAMGYGIYVSIENLVAWVPRKGSGILVYGMLGWLSGLIMVLPNGLLAFYYAGNRRADIVYASQLGDGHICIPMCIGLFALFSPMPIPAFFNTGIAIIAGAGLLHFLFIASIGRLPRYVGIFLTAVYGYFLYSGFFKAL